MMREILSRTKLTDTKRLYEIVAQVKSRLQMYLTGSGHSAAAVRAMAEFSDSSWVTDQISGIAFYGLIEQLENAFEEKKDQIRGKSEAGDAVCASSGKSDRKLHI